MQSEVDEREIFLCPVCGGIVKGETCMDCMYDGHEHTYDNGSYVDGVLSVPRCPIPVCIGEDDEGEEFICNCLMSFQLTAGNVTVWCDPDRKMMSVN